MEKILAGLSNKEGVGVLVTEKSFGITFVNDFICETFGFTKEEFLQLGTGQYMDWKGGQKNIDKFYSVLNGDTHEISTLVRFIRKDRSIFQASANIVNHGEYTVLQIEEIRETGEKFNENFGAELQQTVKVFDTEGKGLLVVSHKDGISYANSTAYLAFGYDETA